MEPRVVVAVENPITEIRKRLGLTKRLLPITPCKKFPYSRLLPKLGGRAKWGPLAHQAATEEDARRWFESDPNLNLGLICGDGVTVLDEDYPDQWPDGVGVSPTVASHRDGENRRRHYYLAGDARTQATPWGHVKGGGSYVLLPGSVHPDGTVYRWAPFCSPAELDLAPLTPHLLERLTARAPLSPQAPRAGQVNEKHIVTRSPLVSRAGVELRAKTAEGRRFEALAFDPEVAFKILRVCGVEVDRIGKAFCCPLPHHQEQHPSASLWQEPGRPIVLHDSHGRGPEWIPLVDVFAAYTTGRLHRLTPAGRVVWWIRALDEARILRVLVPEGPVLPAGAPAAARRLLRGFVYLLAVRGLYDPDQLPEAPFSWGFAADWCGFKSKATVSKATCWLLRHRWLEVTQPGNRVGEGGGRSPTFFALGDAASRYSHSLATVPKCLP